ncbi:L-alanine dehydrogenase [Geosporobacter subterraneus DSM 17957]|uniref:alanine dehydrogenase n=1 Tax=Geosporobacter subterraneus DSM 17957 TaxID=1121919 RepID=A0A1M6JZ61_9FIRM|nr:alanine dehydrogenase [Geosporobacter subterraneus]SHJ51989.1 L-alanine dehydrogenase [Geosporobacter subterraneus DSM 17957]
MIIGIPKESAPGEGRVGMTDIGIRKLIQHGHKVYVQKNAGWCSGITDQMYENAGAILLDTVEDIYGYSDLIVKVKPPGIEEFDYLKDKNIVFSYILPERHEGLTKKFMEKKVTAIGYEGVEDKLGNKPLLIPMSEIAGKMAVFMGAKLMQTVHGGVGTLLAFMPGISPAEVVILGAGSAALGAAEIAIGLGCRVTLLNRSIERIRLIKKTYNDQMTYLLLTEDTLMEAVLRADLLINTIDLMGDKINHLITRSMVQRMKKGSVIVDVACDKGGTIETSSPTTHDCPYYNLDGVIHCAIPNLPGIVPRTSTAALTSVTLPYIVKIAEKGLKSALLGDLGLRKGLVFYKGLLLHKKASENYDLPYTPIEKAMD